MRLSLLHERDRSRLFHSVMNRPRWGSGVLGDAHDAVHLGGGFIPYEEKSLLPNRGGGRGGGKKIVHEQHGVVRNLFAKA
jgi:hypothetical protein